MYGVKLEALRMAKIFRPTKHQLEYDGTDLVIARENMGLNQTDFGELCGWSAPHQCELEKPGIHYISNEKAERIEKAIS